MTSINDMFGLPDDYGDEDAGNPRRFFNLAESLFDSLDYDMVAENLRRYRSGEGGTRTCSKEEMSTHPAFDESIDCNRTHFESKTFTGQTRNSDLNGRLLGLKDDEKLNFKDYWDGNIGVSRPSTYLGFGRTGIYSEGQFRAERNGDCLVIHGTIENRLGTRDKRTETFDFNTGQVGSLTLMGSEWGEME